MFAELSRRDRYLAITLVLCVLLAAAVRIPMLSGQRFHPDEALYATWARWVATGQDVWLAARVVDKPPLFIYTLAVPFATIGASEEVARAPNFAASIASVVLTALIAHALYGDARVAGLAAVGMALSPIAMLFSVTAFTDPFTLMWVLAAVLAALRRRWTWCGFWWGLALASKQDAALAAPLLVAIAWSRSTVPQRWRPFGAMGAGLVLPVAVVAGWTWVRPQPDFLSASLQHYASLTLASGDLLAERTAAWFGFLRGVAPEALVLAGVAGASVMSREVRRSADLWLPLCAVLWVGLHLAISFPAWDRYALPLAPLAAIWLARMGVWWYDRLKARTLQVAFVGSWILCLLLPARAALAGEIDMARDFGRHAGIDAIGDYFWKTDTSATILYVHDLSWEVDYYTFGRDLDRRWFPDAPALAADAAHMTWARRYIVLADWEAERVELPAALAAVGLSAKPVFVTARADEHPALHLMQITPTSP